MRPNRTCNAEVSQLILLNNINLYKNDRRKRR